MAYRDFLYDSNRALVLPAGLRRRVAVTGGVDISF